MEKLHPKAVWLFFFRFFLIGFLLFVFILLSIFSAVARSEISLPFLSCLFLLLFLIYLAGAYFWARLTYNAYKYQLIEGCFKKEHGVIYKKYVSIPYGRIQNVDIHRGILARILGLSDLMIQTAGYATSGRGFFGREPEGKLPGLSIERAEQLREELIRRAKGTKAGV